MYYYTYSIEVINSDSSLFGRIYFGKHETRKLDDNYFGSGTLILRYIANHGTDGLKKTILSFYPDRESLLTAEEALIDSMRMKYGDRCMNLQGGGRHPHWKDIVSDAEKDRRRQLVVDGIYSKTDPQSRHERAMKAGLARKLQIDQDSDKWSYRCANVHANRDPLKKREMYNKVSASLSSYYERVDKDSPEWGERIDKNRRSNIAASKQWRSEFFNLFGRTPESFRASGKMKDSIAIYKKIKSSNMNKEEIEHEINRFMEGID